MNRNRALWIGQGVLAVLFLVAGGMKRLTPAETLAAMSPYPAAFIQFIGVCEVLGAVGLILPWALRLLPVLTPLAALGLAVIMLGATATTLGLGGGTMAAPTIGLGLLAALVAYGRWPRKSAIASRRPALRPVG